MTFKLLLRFYHLVPTYTLFVRKSQNGTYQRIFHLKNGILLPKLLGPTVRKNCPSDREKTFEIRGQEFAKFLRSLEQSIQTVQ